MVGDVQYLEKMSYLLNIFNSTLYVFNTYKKHSIMVYIFRSLYKDLNIKPFNKIFVKNDNFKVTTNKILKMLYSEKRDAETFCSTYRSIYYALPNKIVYINVKIFKKGYSIIFYPYGGNKDSIHSKIFYKFYDDKKIIIHHHNL